MLQIVLLGPPQVLVDGEPLVLRPRNSARARAILYYLAASGRPETRERLAGLLWSDMPEKKARDYLRGELFLLNPLKPACLVEQDGRLALDRTACTVDLHTFRRLLAEPEATVEELDAALRLWSGDFLEGVESGIEESGPLYVEWLEEQRTLLAEQQREARYRLAETTARTQTRLDLGIAACAHLLRAEPEREEVHRLKMRLLAQDGQRTAALKQYDECTAALLDELGVPPSAETNALYDQIVGGELGPTPAGDGAPASAAAKEPPFQAPARATHFVGRNRELAQLAAWLAEPDSRGPAHAVCAVVGMGGAGKTALAVHAAHALRSRFPDGVLWARVSSSDPLDTLQSWGLAFDKDLSKIGSAEARAAAMRNILATKRALIVLDDVAAGALVDLLLPGAAQCPVLITTRDRAEVAARTTRIVDLAELAPAEGIELLAAILGPDGVAAEAEAAAALCATLGGLPLALEIAAQRVFASPRRSLGRMVRSLQDAGDRLGQGISNRSVRTSFDASWEALPPTLRAVFALTGLAGSRSFTAAAIAAALADGLGAEGLGAEGLGAEGPVADEFDVADDLDQLAMLSMLRAEPGERYVHHRLLADFAREKLAALGTAPAAQHRYAVHYLGLVQRAGSNYDRLELDWDNLLEAVQIAHAQQAWGLVTQLVDALAAPWFARARFAQARQGYTWALEAAAALGDEARRARYAYFLAKVLLRQDEYAAARHQLGIAIHGFGAAQDRLRLADAYVDLADVAIEQGVYGEAEDSLAAAQAIFADTHQAIGLATIKSRQALLAFYEFRNADARRLCEEGLSVLPAGDGAIVRSRTLRLLTDVAITEQQLDEAADYCRQAQVANQSVNDPTESAAILYAQAKLDHFLGNHDPALASATACAHIYEQMGDRKASAIVHHFISRVHVARNEPAAARAAAGYGLQIAQALDDAMLVALCEEQLAVVAAVAAAAPGSALTAPA